MKTEDVIRKILRDIRVELSSEFDRNFERQAFFSEAWARRKSPVKGSGHILVDSGQLRRSIRAKVDDDSITFSSDQPYAAIHNEGGDIGVTARMKRYFWARYYGCTGGFVRLKSGALSSGKRQQRLSTEAEFWKHMALMKVGSKVCIPRRRFLGTSPELEKTVSDIISASLEEYMNTIMDKIQDKK